MNIASSSKSVSIPKNIMDMIEVTPQGKTTWSKIECAIIRECRERKITRENAYKIMKKAGFDRTVMAISNAYSRLPAGK